MEFFMAVFIFIAVVSLYFSWRTAANPRNNIVLNTTLPPEVLKDTRVLEISGKFKKAILLVCLASLAVSPLLVFTDKLSLLILYITLWIAAAIGGGCWVLTLYNRKLSNLKQQNQWFVGNTHTVTVDLEVSRAKDKMPVSKFWFLPSGAIALVLFVSGLISESMTIFPGVSALTGIMLYIYLYTISKRERARAYCEETEINLACNKISIRLWTLCWITLAGVNSLGMALLYLFGSYLSVGIIMAIIGLETFISLAVSILTYSKIRTTRNLLLEGAKAPIFVDEDYYWRGGFIYNNPNDNRSIVEKRIGYGYTFNLGTTNGKRAFYGLSLGVSVLLLTLFLFFISLDTANFKLTIADGQASIHAPMYGYDFPINSIKSITTIDTFPGGERTNGAASIQYSLGNFNLHGYGKSKVYVYNNRPPYIVLELPNLYVFFNAKTSEQTLKYCQLLLESMGNKTNRR